MQQVMKMLSTDAENINNGNDDKADWLKIFSSLVKTYRERDTEASTSKHRTNLDVQPGQSVAAEESDSDAVVEASEVNDRDPTQLHAVSDTEPLQTSAQHVALPINDVKFGDFVLVE
ncbi:hypothetical protein PR048_008461 [Dryococelus australis]|uniref:Uncharacterized protein n=1 Tax=Dryococelus australis TaxID=614101 RepID=A0ABQ9HXH1_9NEOP|nr:hypothetical protein PR048_008461 [Dryococelus australis]